MTNSLARGTRACFSVFAWGVRGIAVLFLAVASAAPYTASADTTFTVAGTDDIADGNPGDGRCEVAAVAGLCTLRAAIQEANHANNLSKGPFIINLQAQGTYKLSLFGPGENAAASGDLDITTSKDVTIQGELATRRDAYIIDGQGADRVFHFLGENNITLANLTIRNGYVSDSIGGGILNREAYVTISNCVISGNRVVNPSKLVENGSGGGIYNATGQKMAITSSLIENNHAITELASSFGGGFYGGGGVYNDGDLTISGGTTFSKNEGRPYGGAILNISRLTMSDSTVADNVNSLAGIPVPVTTGTGGGFFSGVFNNGGGLANIGGSATLNRVIVTGNEATTNGGGIYNYPGLIIDVTTPGAINGFVRILSSYIYDNTAQLGGGISNWSSLAIYYSTVADNNGFFLGGGILSNGVADTLIVNSTVTGNSAKNGGGISTGRAITINNSTISGNRATGGDSGAIGNEIFIGTDGFRDDKGNIIINTNTTTRDDSNNTNTSSNRDSVIFSNTIIGNANSVGSNNCNGGTGTVEPLTPYTPDLVYKAVITSLGYNLENGDSCGLKVDDLTTTEVEGTDIINADPLLGNLTQDNSTHPSGGSKLPNGQYVPVLMPASSSPVINRIPADRCGSTIDQRQYNRPERATPDALSLSNLCDIGAIEVGSSAALKSDLSLSLTKNVTGSVKINESIQYAVTVINEGDYDSDGLITVTVTFPTTVQLDITVPPLPNLVCSIASQVITCRYQDSLGVPLSLKKGEKLSFLVNTTIKSGGAVLVVTAAVSMANSRYIDPPGDNSESVATEVLRTERQISNAGRNRKGGGAVTPGLLALGLPLLAWRRFQARAVRR